MDDPDAPRPAPPKRRKSINLLPSMIRSALSPLSFNTSATPPSRVELARTRSRRAPPPTAR
eukprot:2270486-Prymnesium_polylepis.1